ncbi:MAG: branched-chain amino acid ABC transporter permease [Candidatus Thorarchaeota archaeon]
MEKRIMISLLAILAACIITIVVGILSPGSVNFTVIIAGLLLGGIYGLVASSISLYFGVMKAVNWAVGNLLIMFVYISWILFTSVGWDPMLSIVVQIPVAIVVGIVLQRGIFDGLKEQGRQLMATLGFSVAIYGGIIYLFGVDQRGILLPYTFDSLYFGDIIIQVPRLISGVAGIAMLIIIHLYITKTWHGLAIRATAQNPMMAEISGINVKNIHLLVSVISMVALALAGPLLLIIFTIDPANGGYYITLAFVITLIGGSGNILGALVGGLFLGLSEVLITWFFGSWVTGFSTFLIFVIILLIMPFGQRGG